MNSAYSLYVESLRPILYIDDIDFHTIDESIKELAEESNAVIKEFSMAYGSIDFATKKQQLESEELINFLDRNKDEGYGKHVFLLLKDVHPLLKTSDTAPIENHKIIACLRYIAERTMYVNDYHCTVFIVSGTRVIPKEIEHLITLVHAIKPEQDEIETMLRKYAAHLNVSIKEEEIGNLALELKGLSAFQIRMILDIAYCDGGFVSLEKDKKRILDEKKQIIEKSGMLEFIKHETLEEVGGLDDLRKWLNNKKIIFDKLDDAFKIGIDMPRGVLILGVPGCGKSLIAKTTAKIFDKPLLRLDVGRLLGKYIGESESNMRHALSMAEAVSPCVLWIDEIEKAFAGGTEHGHEVTVRLIGQFLTWMQEKQSTVFVVATANDIQNLPVEFLRKGRFDEIFSVELPDWEERKEILKIHLKKRKQQYRNLNLSLCKDNTEKFSGADLCSAVSLALERAFIDNRKSITDKDLQNAIEDTIPLYKSMSDKFEKIEKSLQKYNFRKAKGKVDSTTKSKNDDKFFSWP